MSFSTGKSTLRITYVLYNIRGFHKSTERYIDVYFKLMAKYNGLHVLMSGKLFFVLKGNVNSVHLLKRATCNNLLYNGSKNAFIKMLSCL